VSSNGGSRRSSATHGGNGVIGQFHFDSVTPSPRNLSQISLQDSGYSGGGEFPSGSRNRLIGSTPQLQLANIASAQNTGVPPGAVAPNSLNNNGNGGAASISRARCPKLSEKMKSLSLDCADMPPPVQSQMRNIAYKVKPVRYGRGLVASGESLDLGRSMSPPTRRLNGTVHRMLPQAPIPMATTPEPTIHPAADEGTHVVIHEYIGHSPESSLYLGDRLTILDNGDPDWRHGFKINDRLEQLITFPCTCVTKIEPGEQPMKLIQNCHIAENKLRLYRDQVVFAKPDHTIVEGRILIRNEHGALVYCPAQYLMLL